MYKERATQLIDFADSEYKSFQMSDEGLLTIYLKSWDAKLLKIIFSRVIKFSYELGSFPADLFIVKDNVFLEKILLEAFGHIPCNHSFEVFHMEDIDDFPFIQVVAENVSVTKE